MVFPNQPFTGQAQKLQQRHRVAPDTAFHPFCHRHRQGQVCQRQSHLTRPFGHDLWCAGQHLKLPGGKVGFDQTERAGGRINPNRRGPGQRPQFRPGCRIQQTKLLIAACPCHPVKPGGAGRGLMQRWAIVA